MTKNKKTKSGLNAALFLTNLDCPSGNPEPSADDIEATHRLVEAGKLLGIPVIDHIIIGDGEYVSMRGLELME